MNPPNRSNLWAVVVVLLAAVASVLAVLLAINIMSKKEEAKNPFFRVVELNEQTDDPAVWGKNFPLQYDQYLKTVDQKRTRYGGSEAVPHSPTDADPRTVTAQSRLEADPRLKTMWAGYAFSKDFREERGHAYMLSDQMFTERQAVTKQPGTCINCHASTWVAMNRLGEGDIMKGFDKLNHLPYFEARKEVTHPVSCIDCHDPATMQLRVTRPAFIEGIKAYKKSQGVENYDVNKQATRQEMRTYVCGQCHVEYYFKGPEKRLTYPWAKGIKVEQILSYYDEDGHTDFKHAETGAPVLKAQHPEFEMYNQGIHARSGVACADCHMPYMRVGAQKISDHHVRSPLLNVNNACQTCHHFSEDELRSRAEANQERVFNMRGEALNALMQFIADVKAAKDAGKTEAELATVYKIQKHAQFMIDFVEAENSTGFHAPQEALRILGQAIDLLRQGQLALRDPSYKVTELQALQQSNPETGSAPQQMDGGTR